MKAFKIFSLAVLTLVIASCSHTIEESAGTEETQTETKIAVVANDAVNNGSSFFELLMECYKKYGIQ